MTICFSNCGAIIYQTENGALIFWETNRVIWSRTCLSQILVSTFSWSSQSALTGTCRHEHQTTIKRCRPTKSLLFVIIVTLYTNKVVSFRTKRPSKVLSACGNQASKISINIFLTVIAVRSIKSYDYGIMPLSFVKAFSKYIMSWSSSNICFYELMTLLFEKKWVENTIESHLQGRCIITENDRISFLNDPAVVKTNNRAIHFSTIGHSYLTKKFHPNMWVLLLSKNGVYICF